MTHDKANKIHALSRPPHSVTEDVADMPQTWTRPKADLKSVPSPDLAHASARHAGLWAIVHESPLLRHTYVEASLPVETRDRRETALDRPAYEVKALFEQYAEAWVRDTLYAASVEQMVLNLNYQKIIGLGPHAVPLIMDRLRHEVGHWFWALAAIVGDDKAAGAETLDEARKCWLEWFDTEYVGE